MRSSIEGRDARVAADRVVRQLELVALADEHAEGALAVARCGRRVGEAAAQEGERGVQLPLVVPFTDGGLDQVGLDAERPQPALDPLGAPAVEPPAVVGEAVGEAGVVGVAPLAQLADHRVDHPRRYAAAISGTGGASSSRSIGWTRSWSPSPSAS